MSWERLRSSYDQVAGRYEETFRDELGEKPYDRRLLDRWVSAVENPVLEVGCGPGQVGAYLQERGRQVVGTDLSLGMARLAARRLPSAAVADLRSLPIRRASVGAVLAFYSIIHIPRPQLGGALSEFRRVLRPGGRILLSAHEGDGEFAVGEFLGEAVPFVATFFNLDELVAATRSAGMEVTLAERRPPYEAEHPTVRLYVEARCPSTGVVSLGQHGGHVP